MRRLIVLILSVIFLFGVVLLPTVDQLYAQGTPINDEQSGEISDNASVGEVQTSAANGMELVAQSGELALYFNKSTTEIAVKNISSGKVWYSNMPDRENDPIAEPLIKSRMGSQLQFYYYSKSGSNSIMDNFNDSISKGQFNYKIENGRITVDYEVGDMSSVLSAPKRIAIKRFENEILPAIKDEADRKTVKESYRLATEAGYYEAWGNLSKNKKDRLREIFLKNN
jgi:hypothetical protein